MSMGHVIFAQNSSINYVRQAYALALSIKKYNTINNVCLITNDSIPLEYISAFDHIVKIPWGDMSKDKEWKIENRWKIIYCTPFSKNLVYDADMILLNSNDHYWYHLEDYEIALTETVRNYKGNKIISKDNPYRKVFYNNDLPDIYFGLHYFKKSPLSFSFYKFLEHMIKEWPLFSKEFTKFNTQKNPSLDVASAMALKFGNFYRKNNLLSFIHMKPLVQEWTSTSVDKWQDHVVYNWSDDLSLKIGNYNQSGLLHYIDDEFLTDSLIEKLK